MHLPRSRHLLRSSLALGVGAIALGLASPTPMYAQRPPPIATEFDGEADAAPDDAADDTGGGDAAPSDTDPADAEREEPPAPSTAGSPAPARRPPPIITEFDGEFDLDDAAALYGPDEDESDAPLPVVAPGVIEDEDPVEARRFLQRSLLVARRRQMAARGTEPPGARLLASPFRGARAPLGTEADPARLPRAIDRLELGVVAANAPVTSIGIHDDGIRVRVGVPLDAVREPVGVRIRLEPMISLYNDGTFGLPREYVRGAFAVSSTYRAPLPELPVALFVGAAYEHESDHTTSGSSDFVQTNAIALRGGALFDGGILHGLARLALRAHVYSHTSIVGDGGGDGTAEVALDVVLRSGSPESVERNIQLCGAVHASYVAPSGSRILEEAHLDLLLGACARDPVVGELSLSVEVNLGNESGWDRRTQTAHFGGVLRWSL